MRYATTPLACQLTGLSTERLREWTSRRALIPADIRPKRKGSPAKYTWQTILVLRLAVTLREHFHIELQAHKGLFDGLRRELKTKSFIALWGRSVALVGKNRWMLLGNVDGESPADDMLLLRLNSHLEVLSAGFALPGRAAALGQFDLFPVEAVASQAAKKSRRVATDSMTSARRRRSA